jgi:hypothetical protein
MDHGRQHADPRWKPVEDDLARSFAENIEKFPSLPQFSCDSMNRSRQIPFHPFRNVHRLLLRFVKNGFEYDS